MSKFCGNCMWYIDRPSTLMEFMRDRSNTSYIIHGICTLKAHAVEPWDGLTTRKTACGSIEQDNQRFKNSWTPTDESLYTEEQAQELEENKE